MLKKKILIMLMALLILLVSVPTMALADSGTAKFKVPRTLVIAGNEIKAGEYNVKWESNSPEAVVEFTVNGKVVLKVQGKIVEGGTKFDYNSLVVTKDSSGRGVISGLQFGGKKFTIVVE